jgi:hypothetical protein
MLIPKEETILMLKGLHHYGKPTLQLGCFHNKGPNFKLMNDVCEYMHQHLPDRPKRTISSLYHHWELLVKEFTKDEQGFILAEQKYNVSHYLTPMETTLPPKEVTIEPCSIPAFVDVIATFSYKEQKQVFSKLLECQGIRLFDDIKHKLSNDTLTHLFTMILSETCVRLELPADYAKDCVFAAVWCVESGYSNLLGEIASIIQQEDFELNIPFFVFP